MLERKLYILRIGKINLFDSLRKGDSKILYKTKFLYRASIYKGIYLDC